MKKIILILMLLVCIIPIASAANFVWYPTTATDYHSYQGERIQGWVDNADADSISIISYTWNDGITSQSLIYARGYIISGVREYGAAYYPSLPADGKWWKSNDGGNSWVSSSFSEIYSGTIYAGRNEAFYAGYPNHADDLKTNSLTIDVYNMNPMPSKIDTDTYTYYVKRLYPYVYTTSESDNPHVGGTDVATQTLQFNTSISDYVVYTIDHYYLDSNDNPQMAMRYHKKWDSATNQWMDTYWRQTLDSGSWSTWSGDYTWEEAYKAEFLTNEAGNYILRTSIYDYKGRSHYNTNQDREIVVTTPVDYMRIYTQEKGTNNPVLNNVYITVKDGVTQTTIYAGYLQGSYLELSFNSPRVFTVQASAPGYTPDLQIVTKTFTTEDNELIYLFEKLGTISEDDFDTGTLRFVVREAGTNKPLPNTKIKIEDYDYITDGNGVIDVRLPANGFGRVTPTISFGIADAYDKGIMGDWNGDGIDTFGIVRQYGLIFWYLSTYNADGSPYSSIQFANVGSSDIHPFTGDFNGDGIDTFGVYRSGKPEFILSTSTGSVYSRFDYDLSTYYGDNYDKITVLSGDWNGDGIDTIGTFYNGIWRLWSANNAGRTINQFAFGMEGDKPVVGDWNGDGIDTVGVRRGNLFILSNVNAEATPTSTFRFYYGQNEASLFPLAGDYNGDGKDKIGIWDNGNAKFYLSTGGYNYEVSSTGRPKITGIADVFTGKQVTLQIILERISAIQTPRPGDRPEGEGVGLIQVLTYLMEEEGIEEKEDQDIILGMLIIAFSIIMVGGLVGGSYGVLGGGIFGFILSVTVGFIPIWIPLTFITIAGIYILMKGLSGER